MVPWEIKQNGRMNLRLKISNSNIIKKVKLRPLASAKCKICPK